MKYSITVGIFFQEKILEGDFIMQKTPKELMDGIMKMLKGNYRAMRLVYSFLVGLTGGIENA